MSTSVSPGTVDRYKCYFNLSLPGKRNDNDLWKKFAVWWSLTCPQTAWTMLFQWKVCHDGKQVFCWSNGTWIPCLYHRIELLKPPCTQQHNFLFMPWHRMTTSFPIANNSSSTSFTSAFAITIEDEGTSVQREPVGSVTSPHYWHIAIAQTDEKILKSWCFDNKL